MQDYLGNCGAKQDIKRIPMTGNELVGKILAGERELQKIQLEKGFDFYHHRRFFDVEDYLKEQAERGFLEKAPLNFSYSDFTGLIARGMFAPYTIAEHLILNVADISHGEFNRAKFNHLDGHKLNASWANFEEAQINNSYLLEINAEGTNFDYARVEDSVLSRGNFRLSGGNETFFNRSLLDEVNAHRARWAESHLNEIYGYHLNFDAADLRRAVMKEFDGLKTVRGLGTAWLNQVKVDSKESKKILRKYAPYAEIIVDSKNYKQEEEEEKQERIKTIQKAYQIMDNITDNAMIKLLGIELLEKKKLSENK